MEIDEGEEKEGEGGKKMESQREGLWGRVDWKGKVRQGKVRQRKE